MHYEAQINPQNNKGNSKFKKLTKEKKVFCHICARYFRNKKSYDGHKKVHNKKAMDNIRKSKLGNQNPAKRLDVRKKISEAAKGRNPWNKNIQWAKDKIHNKIVNRVAESLKTDNVRVITTHYYVPDAIIIDFENKTVKAFELNPGSTISKGIRAKEKGYDYLVIKIRRNGKYRFRNMDRTLSTKEF